MKRLLAGMAGIAGIFWWRNRQKPTAPDPAEELRAKLAQAREADDRDEFEAGETPVDEVPDDGDVDARRRSVHDRARAATDELRPPDSP